MSGSATPAWARAAMADDTPPQWAARAMDAANSAPTRVREGLEGVGRNALGFALGASSLPLGVAEFAGEVGKRAGLGGGLAAAADSAARRSQAAARAMGAGGMYEMGDVFNPLYLALPESRVARILSDGVPVIEKAAPAIDAAITGAGVSAVQPAPDDAGYFQGAAHRAEVGAAVGAPLGAVAAGLRGSAASDRAALARKGVRLSTTEVLPPRIGGPMREAVGVTPARFAESSGQARSLSDYQRVLYNMVLEPSQGVRDVQPESAEANASGVASPGTGLAPIPQGRALTVRLPDGTSVVVPARGAVALPGRPPRIGPETINGTAEELHPNPDVEAPDGSLHALHYGENEPVGRKGIKLLRERLHAFYDKALGNKAVALPSAGLMSPRWLALLDDVQAPGAIAATGMDEAFSRLGLAAQEEIMKGVRDEFAHPLHYDLTRPGGTISPRALKAAQSDLRKHAFALSSAPESYRQHAGQFLAQLANRITEVIARANPDRAHNLRIADQMWGRFSVLERAVEANKDIPGVEPGIVPARLVARALRPHNGAPTMTRWEAGELPMQEELERDSSLVPAPARASILGLTMGAEGLAGLAGYHLGGLGGLGATAAMMGATAFPFTRAGSALARAIAFSPASAKIASGAVAPAATAASGGANP